MTENSIFLIIGDTLLYWHGLIVMLGVIAGAALSCFLRTWQGHKKLNDLLIAILISLPLALVGARIYFCWHGQSMFSDKSQYYDLSNGGYSVYGALFGVFIGIAIAALIQRRSVGEMLDVSVPGTALAIAIGRMGAAFSAENLGSEVTAGLFQRFPFAMYCENEGIWRSALFSYQSLIALLICAGSIYLVRQKYCEKTLACKKGDIYLLFVVVYFVIQGIFECYRTDALYFNAMRIQKLQTIQAGMPMGAIFSAAALAVFILRMMWRKKFALSTLWSVFACAISYFCYFNIVLRVEIHDALAMFLFIGGCLGLIAIGVSLFLSSAEIQFDRSTLGRPRPSGRSDRPARRQPESHGESRKPSRSKPPKVDYWS